jgi:hypothetical protein
LGRMKWERDRREVCEECRDEVRASSEQAASRKAGCGAFFFFSSSCFSLLGSFSPVSSLYTPFIFFTSPPPPPFGIHPSIIEYSPNRFAFGLLRLPFDDDPGPSLSRSSFRYFVLLLTTLPRRVQTIVYHDYSPSPKKRPSVGMKRRIEKDSMSFLILAMARKTEEKGSVKRKTFA